ncbi:hypothetical protein BP6252_09772 [Coleophoma cylindrospora]|uniref:Transcription factor domain-containing protein n=1 Tax=Coleophoma cylindrospora TaxID=1849047 RepID=A0A3D8QWJ4_9HELO|nr:hypothetical protein BP6252_09772 [Coleophoma cylindrospora]
MDRPVAISALHLDKWQDVVWTSSMTSSPLRHRHLNPPDLTGAVNQETCVFLINQLLSLPREFATTAATPFMHHKLYEKGLPPLLHELKRLCTLHSTTQDPIPFHQALQTTTTRLLTTTSTIHTFSSTLTLVQALLLLQILTLFNFHLPPPLRRASEQRIPLLRHWTQKLYLSAPAALPGAFSAYRAWIVAESVRRTILVSHKVEGIYAMLKEGVFAHTLFVEALPFASRNDWWGAAGGGDAEPDGACVIPSEEPLGPVGLTDLVSYREFRDAWVRGEIRELGLFEQLLIATCLGVEAVKLRH